MQRWKMLSLGNSNTSHESLLMAIGDALGKVHEGSTDDESIALDANKIVRRCLDKRCISYRDYRTWRKRNRLVFTPLVDEDNKLVGFFDIFPFTLQTGEDVIEGKLTERSLRAEHIVPFADIVSTAQLHIASIIVNPGQKSFPPIIARELLLLKMREFIGQHYAPIEKYTYTAFAETRAGERLLKRCGFSLAVLADENEQHAPLYVLRPGKTAKAIFRFNRADTCVGRTSEIRDIDSRIQRIELQLRGLITSRLNGDPKLLPPHISQNAREKIGSAIKKNVSAKPNDYNTFSVILEFCDLRELETIIASKSLWSQFQPTFVNKETMVGKFSQLAELRNAIRHSRTIDEITRKEGEAGVIWFERNLSI